MKRTETQFECDKEGCGISANTEYGDLPDGWVETSEKSGKYGSYDTHHFCSWGHTREWIDGRSARRAVGRHDPQREQARLEHEAEYGRK